MSNDSFYEGYFKDDKMHGHVRIDFVIIIRVNTDGLKLRFMKGNGERIVCVDLVHLKKKEKYIKVVKLL